MGQPGRSFVLKTPPPAPFGLLMVLVPSHLACSDAVAWGERPCSVVASVCPCSFLLEVSELVPEQPTIRRRTKHPIRKVTTTAMRCLWRITAHPPSLGMCPLLLAPRSMPHDEALRISQEALFTGMRGIGTPHIAEFPLSHGPAKAVRNPQFPCQVYRRVLATSTFSTPCSVRLDRKLMYGVCCLSLGSYSWVAT